MPPSGEVLREGGEGRAGICPRFAGASAGAGAGGASCRRSGLSEGAGGGPGGTGMNAQSPPCEAAAPEGWGGAGRPTPRATYGLDTMHPSRRSLPFPLNCQLVRVGTADYGGILDQVSESRRGEPAPLAVFVLVMKAGSAPVRARAPACSPVHFAAWCPAGPAPPLEGPEGLCLTRPRSFWRVAPTELWLATCPSHPGGAHIYLWTLRSQGF